MPAALDDVGNGDDDNFLPAHQQPYLDLTVTVSASIFQLQHGEQDGQKH